MTSLALLAPVAGGALIASAAVLLLVANGRLAGVSGILSGLLVGRRGEGSWRLLFIGGMVLGGAVGLALAGAPVVPRQGFPAPLIAVAGVLAGFGAARARGCTSGHGVCGIGRLSVRSVVATLVSLAAAIGATFVVRHVFGIA